MIFFEMTSRVGRLFHTVFFSFDNYATTCLNHLPTGRVCVKKISLDSGIPGRNATRRIIALNDSNFFYDSANRKMIAVVIVHIEKRMGQRAIGEGIRVGAPFANKCSYGLKHFRFDCNAFTMNNVRAFIYFPYALA